MAKPLWPRSVAATYLEGDPGPPPRSVRVAIVLSGVCVVASLAMVWVYAPLALTGDRTAFSFVVAGLVTAGGLALAVTFWLSVTHIESRGWRRVPMRAGGVLGGLALFSFWLAGLASEDLAGETSQLWLYLLPRSGPVAAVSLGLVYALSRSDAQDWLAKRRHQARRQ